jgi:peptidoglycan/LPS O-acetylase OafA/YrhL
MSQLLDRSQTRMKTIFDNSLTYRPDIDGLRAFAVLSVVFYHVNIPGFSGGFVGVDIFFVISGYLITSLILKDMDDDCFSFFKFYLRRAKRIFPALIVVLITTTIASWFILFPYEFQKFGRSLFHTTFFASNIYFAHDAGYFSAPAIDKPLLHTWSLAIEEQFYIVFPAMLALFLPRLGRSKMALTLLAVTVFSLLAAEIQVRRGSETAFFMPHVRAWELLLGGLVVFQQDRGQFSQRFALLLSVFGVGAIVFAVTMLTSATPFPGLNAVLPCGGTALLLLAGGKHSTPIQAIISVSPVRFVGQVSYSLYLWHWPLFSLTHYYLDRRPDALETALLIGASFVLAVVSWWLIEQPIRTSKIGFTNPLRGIALTSALFVPLAVIGVVFFVTRGLPWRFPPEIAAVYKRSITRPVFYKGCDTFQGCQFGVPPKNNAYDIVVWGDSHAQHFIPVLTQIAEKEGLSGWQITPYCGALLNVTNCGNNHETIKRFVQENKSIKAIFLITRWSAYHEQIKDGLQETVNYFRNQGLEVVVVGQVPALPFDPARCNFRKMLNPATAPECSITIEELHNRVGYSNGVIAQLEDDPGVTRIYPYELLCDRTSCKSMLNGMILYRDTHHILPAGSLQFYSFFKEKLTPLLTQLKTEKNSRK